MFEALLFDLDGTLVDSEPWHKQAEIVAFRQFGIEVDEVDLAQYMGATLFDLLNGIESRFDKKISPEDFLEVEQPILTRFIDSKVNLFDDTRLFLNNVASHRKALVTSSMRWYVDRILSRFPMIGDSMEFIVCGADVVDGKPHPEGYLAAAARLAADPERCCVFEDSINGVRAGHASGAYVIAIDRTGANPMLDADETWTALDFERLRRVESERFQRL